MSNNNNTSTILPLITTTAIVIGTTISLLQIDTISKYIFSAKTTRAKRRNEILYKLNEYINTRWYTHRKSLWDKENISASYSIDNELVETELISKDEDIEGIILDIIGDGKETTTATTTSQDEDDKVKIVAIEQTKTNMEYYINLSLPALKQRRRRRVQISLLKFSTTFQTIFENKVITNTALCFISDGSCNLTNVLLGHLLSTDQLGLGIVMEPLWMLSIALLVKDQVISDKHMQSILFTLCRLEAWNFRHTLGKNRTVVFFLPGQCSVSTLTPILQKVFMHERHVYSYDTCLNSISRALSIQNHKSSLNTKNHTPIDISSGTSLTDILQTSPFISQKKEYIMLSSKKLPKQQSNILESWMNSIDTFLVLKEDELKNGYLPFTLRLPFLYDKTLTSKDDDNVNVNYDGDSFIIFCHFLQFVTGTRSRPLQDELLKLLYRDFISFMNENQDVLYLNSRKTSLSSAPMVTKTQEDIIEQIVFLHKRILIQSKTLLDTVMPKKDWSLKAARKLTGCACCAPEEESDDEDDGMNSNEGALKASPFLLPGTGSTTDMVNNSSNSFPKRSINDNDVDGNDSGGVAIVKKKSRSKYVDGKMGFAFDPTMFS